MLERALALATHAPSAGNTQGWAFIVLEGEDTARFWQHEADSSWLAHPSHPGLLNAPVIVLPAGQPGAATWSATPSPTRRPSGRGGSSDWAVPYWLVDTAFATMLLLLGLTQEGLGGLFFALRKPAGPLLGRARGARRLGSPWAPWPWAGRARTTGRRPRPAGPARAWPRWSIAAAGSSARQTGHEGASRAPER